MKVALVHDDLIQEGVAEKLVLAMHEIWPKAPLYTSFASNEWVKKCREQGITLQTSFMRWLPFKKHLYKFYFLFYPLAFESFNFNQFDLVVSSSARFAHGIITKPITKHLCYMNSPARMWWDPVAYFGPRLPLRLFLAPFLSFLRLWDYTAAQRVDYFVANSKAPQSRIKKYYGRESEIVYPFSDLTIKKSSGGSKNTNYFLIVTRLSPWKRVDIAVAACQEMGRDLVVVGWGPDSPRLKRLAAGSKHIRFLGKVNDEELVALYSGCQAVIITQEEDFGIVAVEAASFHKPVLAYKAGGSLELIKEGSTGEFFYPQTATALKRLLANFQADNYCGGEDYDRVVAKFSKEVFKTSLESITNNIYDV